MKINNKKKLLILSPHTDDAELGAGGTIIKFLNQGFEIKWIVFSSAEDSVPSGFNNDSLKKEFLDVVNELGLASDNYFIHNFKVRYLHEKRQEVLQILYNERKEYCPDIVIGPSQNDMHQDHKVVSNEMIRAFKNTSSILAYELPWNHFNFNSQFFVTLNKEIIDKKIKLLKNYKTQFALKRSYFLSENITSLARVRGTQSNCEFAEAFELVKWID